MLTMERKQEILEAARDLFLKQGRDGLKMREIAARVEISATAIYRHYKDKDALLKAVVDLGRERFASFLVRSLKGKTPRERLLLTGLNYLEFAFVQPHDYRIMFMAWDQLELGRHASPPGQGEYAPLFQFLLDRIRECLPAERLARPEALFELGLLFWAQCHGLASLYLGSGVRQLMPEEQYRNLCRRELELLVAAAID